MSQPCHYSGLKPSRVMASVVEWLDGGRAEDKMSAAARLTQQRHMKYRAGKKARALELLQTKDALEATVQSLQDRARSRKPTSLLSWKSISVALKDSRDDSHRQNRDLRAQIHALQRLMSELGAWVDMTVLTPHTNLPQHPESRRMAKAWITQRMLHSTDAMFQQHGFPAWDAPQEDMDVWCDEDFTFSDMGIVCRSRRNYIDQQSLEDSISFDFLRVRGGRTRKRVLTFTSQCHFTGEFDLEAEANTLGLSLTNCPDHLKESRFRLHVVQMTHSLRSQVQRDHFHATK
ncbi:hypothetical protein DYB30_012706 [Aphanomyces astaci]|uniref:Uncharacterized protein n=1 Tax=Aphanomyces astaci TaxID=112090 RepID=A0A397A0S8_APHAT|nr:hypothetical protein DYB36_011717 [Aphanomyces astaci]RHY44490.1 hypothetical protein DYB30_012706 [Aphanomyces astaci]RHZ03373.1 hypothetical protein DYB26_011495 [Aphanomyces astaci]